MQKGIKNNKVSAPGIDGISYLMIANLPNKILTYLLSLYNQILSGKEIPAEWQHQLAILLKLNKDQKGVLSYQPLTFLSSMSKILDSIAKNRIEWIVEDNSLLPNNMTDFGKVNTTTNNVIFLSSSIHDVFSQKTKKQY